MPSSDDSWSPIEPSSNMSSPITIVGSPSPSPPPTSPEGVPFKSSEENPDVTPLSATREDFGTPYKNHETFFFDDGSVTFLVEKTIYKPHRFFFVRDSPWFAARLSIATSRNAEPAKGPAHAEEKPITLDGVTSQDFDAFLSILYPSRFDEHEAKSQAQWHSVLRLAHTWSFTSIRSLAIHHLDSCVSPFDRLVLARTYGIDDWVVPALTALCSRSSPLEVEEVEQMQAKDIALAADVREQLRTAPDREHAEEEVQNWLNGATKATRLMNMRKKEAAERVRALRAQALLVVENAAQKKEREVQERERKAREHAWEMKMAVERARWEREQAKNEEKMIDELQSTIKQGEISAKALQEVKAKATFVRAEEARAELERRRKETEDKAGKERAKEEANRKMKEEMEKRAKEDAIARSIRESNLKIVAERARRKEEEERAAKEKAERKAQEDARWEAEMKAKEEDKKKALDELEKAVRSRVQMQRASLIRA